MAIINAIKRKDLKTPKWQYDVRVDGHKRQRAGSFKTKKEALAAGHELAKQLESGLALNKDIRFTDYYHKWVEAHDKKSLSKAQYDHYKKSIRIFAEKYGEDKLLRTITRSEYQALLSEYGKGRTKETVRKLHSCLSPVLQDAVYEGFLVRDPTYKAKVEGTVPPQPEEDKYTTKENYFKLLEYFKSKKELSYILLYTIAITGARFSEANNMTWAGLNKGPGLVFLPGTKNETAPRDVEVSEENIEWIKKQLEYHPRKISGKLFGVSNQAARKCLRTAMKNIGMDEEDWITIYGLRHTHCSVLYSEGVKLKYISKRLGHASLSTTLKIYHHMLDEDKKSEGDKVRNII